MMENKDCTQRSGEDALEEMMKSMSQEEFRREYLNEPVLTRNLDELRPSCVIIDDTGEQWHHDARKEIENLIDKYGSA